VFNGSKVQRQKPLQASVVPVIPMIQRVKIAERDWRFTFGFPKLKYGWNYWNHKQRLATALRVRLFRENVAQLYNIQVPSPIGTPLLAAHTNSLVGVSSRQCLRAGKTSGYLHIPIGR
jgi:hypothetical protein